jgi:hypothetical protein
MYNNKKNTLSDYFYIGFLLFPIVSYWLFPSSFEEALTLKMFGFPLFLPEVSWFLCPLFKRKYTFEKKFNKDFIYFGFIVSFLSILFSLFSLLDTFTIAFSSAFDLFAPLIILGFFPIYKRQYPILVKFLFLSWFFLCFQVIFYSLGLLLYPGISNNSYGMINRISTTIGAATGTGVILFMLTAIILHLMGKRINVYKYLVILVVGSVSIFLTMSRGSIIAFVLLLLFIILDSQSISRLKRKNKIIIVVLYLVVLCLVEYNSNLWEVIVGRSNETTRSEDFTTGRDIRWIDALNTISNNAIVGVGLGAYNSGKRVLLIENNAIHQNSSPHNLYLLLLAEVGILGLISFIWFLREIYKYSKINFNSNKILFITFWISIIVINNIEVVNRDMEFSFIFYLIFSLSRTENTYKNES